MKTTLRIMPLALAAVLVFAACGGDSDSEKADAGAPPAADDDHVDDDPAHNGDDSHEQNSAVAAGAREIAVSGVSFAFDPAALSAKAGEHIAVVLTSTDIFHDFVIDEFDAHISAAADEPGTGGFTADTAGTYAFYCSVPGHRAAGMEGTLTVT